MLTGWVEHTNALIGRPTTPRSPPRRPLEPEEGGTGYSSPHRNCVGQQSLGILPSRPQLFFFLSFCLSLFFCFFFLFPLFPFCLLQLNRAETLGGQGVGRQHLKPQPTSGLSRACDSRGGGRGANQVTISISIPGLFRVPFTGKPSTTAC